MRPHLWLSNFAARTPLRVKLVATVLVIGTAGLAVAGFCATTLTHSYLLNQIDDSLMHARIPAANLFGDGPTFSGNSTGGTQGGGPEGTVSAGSSSSGRTRSGQFSQFSFASYTSTGAVISPATQEFEAPASVPKLPTMTSTFVASKKVKPFSVRSVNGKSSWRVIAIPVDYPDGTTGSIAVATSLDGLNHTIGHLEFIELLIGVAVLILMGGGGFLLIKQSLRPLAEVETTAEAIAAGDLSRRVPDAPAHTEVGRLSNAFNAMLGRIEESFEHQRESEQQARASEDRMRRFIADASHELRTPLTSIRGFAELHRMGAATDEADVQRMMRRIEDEANRMGVLVEDLLLLARLDQQRPIEHVPVDLLDIARDVVDDAALIAPKRSIDLQAHAEVPPVVTGDESRLRQVVHNLMANALTHTPDGTPVTVTVSTSDNDQKAFIEVADAGPGLSDVEMEHVFERFYRADPARSRNAGGTGLGLSIVAGLVAAHGGRVTVNSEPGNGASFRVELPLAATASEVEPAAAN